MTDKKMFDSFIEDFAKRFPSIFVQADDGSYYTNKELLIDGMQSREIDQYNFNIESDNYMTANVTLRKERRRYDIDLIGSGIPIKFAITAIKQEIMETKSTEFRFRDEMKKKFQLITDVAITTGVSIEEAARAFSNVANSYSSMPSKKELAISNRITMKDTQCNDCEYNEDLDNCAFGCGEYDDEGNLIPCPGHCKKEPKKKLQTERDILL